MLDYNTQTRQLALPEYGRNIQQMVDFCVTIPDREERTRCAYTIIDVMRNLMTDNNNQDENLKKYWDHLNIMADFKLDIDFPYEVISKEELNPVPNRIPYNTTSIRYRHYGKNIEHMINRVAELENSDDKELLISFIAHHMKKLMLIHNKEGATDAKILRDLAEFSNGRINLDPENYLLHEFHEASNKDQNQNKKQKRKRNK